MSQEQMEVVDPKLFVGDRGGLKKLKTLLMVFINGILIQRATNTVAYYGCHNGLQATG